MIQRYNVTSDAINLFIILNVIQVIEAGVYPKEWLSDLSTEIVEENSEKGFCKIKVKIKDKDMLEKTFKIGQGLDVLNDCVKNTGNILLSLSTYNKKEGSLVSFNKTNIEVVR